MDTMITTEVFQHLTIDHIAKANKDMLTAFIKMRTNASLFDKFNIAVNKGTPAQVRKREIDKKTKGPLLIEHAHIVRLQVVICKLPTLDKMEPNIGVEQTQETSICLSFDNESLICDIPDSEWYREMVCSIESLEYNKTTLL